MFQNLDIIESYEPKYIVLLAGDHIYKMDYELMLQQHVDQRADVTVGCLEVPRVEASGFGVMAVDEHNVIHSFLEKPEDPPALPGHPDKSLCSMGIYVFDAKFLFDQLRRDAEDGQSSHDFGKDIIPYIVRHGRAVAHHFSRSCVRSANEQEAYWRDVGTVDAYWAANIDLTDFTPQLDLYDRDWPIWTYGEITPPAKFVHDQVGRRGQALSSLVSGGCIVSGLHLAANIVVHRRARELLRDRRERGHSSLCRHWTFVAAYQCGRRPRRKDSADLVVGEDPELDAGVSGAPTRESV